MKLTEWFGPEVKPTIIGVYQVDDEDGMNGDWFAFWDGHSFRHRNETAKEAYEYRSFRTCCEPLVKWRGLAEKP